MIVRSWPPRPTTAAWLSGRPVLERDVIQEKLGGRRIGPVDHEIVGAD